MKKFIILVNEGVYGGGDVFNEKEMRELIDEWSGDKDMVDEDGKIVSIEDLIKYGSWGEKVDVYNENMVEMGDDYVSLSIVELED